MATESILEQYRIHDFVSWFANKELVLNPSFQRRSVWDAQARVLLIDSILRQMPLPKIYIRTTIDPRAKRSIREVVDGQQRLRAIIDFANNNLQLTRRAGEFAGMYYNDLTEEKQQEFLSYPLAVDQLVNASDTDVLDVFARLNSYTVTLVAAEKRHAKYQGDFKWDIHDAAKRWKILWEDYKIVTGRDRLRMGDDTLMAEMFSILMKGVTDGGAARIDKLYEEYDLNFPGEDSYLQDLDYILAFIVQNFDNAIRETPLTRPPQFLMFFAAVAATISGIPQGQLKEAPPALGEKGVNIRKCTERLYYLTNALEDEEVDENFVAFITASSGTTQRISTRRVRFGYYLWVMQGGKLPVSAS